MIAAALALLSAAILAYEVLLVRLFAIVQWHHFASMAISIALLGFGASGTMLALWQERLRPHVGPVFLVGALCFALLAPAAFLLAQTLPFNALAIVWEPSQLLYLPLIYLLLALPFFFGASAIGIVFIARSAEIGRLYAVNLLGSAAGALGILGLLFLLMPSEALRVIAVLAALAAGLAALSLPSPIWRRVSLSAAGLALLLALLLPASLFALKMSPFKSLSSGLQVEGAEVLQERSGPLGLLTAVESQRVPLRYVPGLSLTSDALPLPQIALFQDGDALSAITRFDGDVSRLAYLDQTSDALGYHLTRQPSVLLLEPGGTDAVLQALFHGARPIDLVEPDGNRLRMIGEDFAEETGQLFHRPEIKTHLATARSLAAVSQEQWDLIMLPVLGGGTAMGLRETYGVTEEAIGTYLDRLAPEGWLSLTAWLDLPPRQSLRLLSTLISALKNAGVAEPAERVLLIRGLTTVTILAKKSAITAGDIEEAEAFARARSFDLDAYPGMAADEANLVNILDGPYFFEAAKALSGDEAQDFVAAYKFDITPATDERPFFFDLTKWRSLPELLAISRTGGGGLLELGSLILLATLLQAGLLSALLILAPLWFRRRAWRPGRPRWRVAGYFLALGLGFLFVEIAFIHTFTLFLGHPLYAVGLVLTGFLLFAGLGSAATKPLEAWLLSASRRAPSPIVLAVTVILALALLYLLLLPFLFAELIHLGESWRALIALVLIAPLAFAMGMPFPIGLRRVGMTAPELLPWAWGINGCASVMSALLASLIAMQVGITVVILAALLLYALAALVPWPKAQRG